ncbi:MAG: TonB-dependent receptor plug domain-containing protein [Bacteroidales bacterium]|nr:TonB-dependent receptor plug domain-containing protein [Bacteroidales bacterium]
MQKTITFVFVFVIFTISVFSQNYTINGYVSDALTGEKLVNATVFINYKNAVSTNEYGYYSLIIKEISLDSVKLFASLIGYEKREKNIDLRTTQSVNFQLQSNTNIDSIVVTGQIPITQNTDIGTVSIPVNQLKLMPTIGSESDVFKSLQLMPGVQAGSEGKSNLFVRGGSPDENLILLDEVPLYYVSHLGGFLSVFNTDALSSVKMHKGGFPARYGSRLSSVVDIRMKEGDMNNYHGDFAIGLLNTKVLFEGPIIKNKASFIFSVRFLPINLILKPFSFLTNNGQMIGYNFHDVNAKVNYKVNDNNQIFFSFYTGDDNLSVDLPKIYATDQKVHYDQKWGNKLVAFRWNHIFTQKLFLHTTASFTQFRYLNKLIVNNFDDASFFKYDFFTGIRDYSVKTTIDYNVSKNYKLKIGVNSIYHNFSPGLTYFKITNSDTVQTDTTTGLAKFSGFENIFFIENNISIGDFFAANIGLHFSHYYLGKATFTSYEPRIVLNFILHKNFSVKTSYSEMEQYVHLLTNNTISLTPDVWVPSDKNIKPSRSKQYSFGFFKYFPQKSIELSIVSYYKISNNLISYKEGAVFIGNAENWHNKIETGGNGTAYGLEFLLQKKQGRTTGWISYTYAISLRQFENINFGEPYSFKYDRTHDFSIVLSHKINDKITFSGDWVYGSGYPFTMPIGTYNIIDDGTMMNEVVDFEQNQNIFIYADRNSYRMRAYHRLDFAANFTKKVKRGLRTWTVSVYNLYNRQNPYLYYTKYNKNDKKIHLYQQSLFPIIPSISYSLKF